MQWAQGVFLEHPMTGEAWVLTQACASQLGFTFTQFPFEIRFSNESLYKKKSKELVAQTRQAGSAVWEEAKAWENLSRQTCPQLAGTCRHPATLLTPSALSPQLCRLSPPPATL